MCDEDKIVEDDEFNIWKQYAQVHILPKVIILGLVIVLGVMSYIICK